MYDSGKIVVGLLVFVVLFTAPLWMNIVSGKAAEKPNIVLPVNADQMQCVKATEYMRHNHMDLLNEWRDDVVRNDARYFTAPDGNKYEMSLTKTCMKCHSNKDQFCDQCHDYLGVTPYCWDCHVEPQNMEGK